MVLFENIPVSLEALFANRLRSGLTILGVVIGVASVILLVSIGAGAKEYVSGEFSRMGTNLLLVTPGKLETTGGPPILGVANVRNLTLEDTYALKRKGTQFIGVVPVVFGSGEVKFASRTRDTSILGVNEEFPNVRNIHVEVGRFFVEEDVRLSRRVCTIGRTVKAELFGPNNPLGEFVKVSGRKFRVIGIMEKKGRSLGFDIDDLVFIPVKSAQQLFNTDALFEIMVKARGKYFVKSAEREVTKILTQRHQNTIDFTITSQADMLSTLDTILNTLTYVLGGIAGISLLVGGIGIMNIMLVSVKERTREIGIRKAVGARQQDILSQFLTEAVGLSAAGGVCGVLAGCGTAKLLNLIFPALPVHVSAWPIVLAFSVSVAVGVFFGVYPARQAARLNPIASLRYE